MGRKPTAWFWKARRCWAVDLAGERFTLGTDKGDAQRELHRLLSLPPDERRPKVEEPVTAGPTVAEILDKFLDWVEKHRAPRTYDWYLEHIQSFTDSLKKPDVMPVAALKPFHVVEWADKHPSWGGCYRRGALIAIQRPFNWAAKLGYIVASPIPYIEKPQATRREQVITPKESYEAEMDIYSYYHEQARRFAESLIASELKVGHKLDAEHAANEGLRIALKYIRDKLGDRKINRDDFRKLLFAIVEHQVSDQFKHETTQKLDGRREVPVELLNLTAGQLAGIDQAVARESAEKVATSLLAEKNEVNRLVNLLAHLGEYSAASIHRILTSSGYTPPSIGTISNRIKECDEKVEKLLQEHLAQ